MQNYVQPGNNLAVVVSHPTVPVSGDPVRFGVMTGVAVADEGAGGVGSTETMCAFAQGVYDVSVAAVNDSGNSAVAAGDSIYFVDADTPHLSKKASGYYFGIALEAITSGSTDTINVLHVPPPGLGTTPGDGTVTAAKLGANAVGYAALSSTLGTGYIPLPLSAFRLIASNDIPTKDAADGGLISKDTDPLFERSNAATDKSLRISWASASVIEIQAPPIVYPPDLDDTADITVCLFAGMKAGSVDTPTLTVSAWEGVGDTNMGGATAALSTTAGKKTVTLATANVSAAPKCLNLTVTPGAHNTASNDVYLYGAWLEYTRK